MKRTGEETHVVISMPSHHSAGVIKSMRIADNAYIKRHRFDKKILFVGDSITQGYNSLYDMNSYAYQISDYFNADSVIQGVGGTGFAPTTALPTGYKPDMVFIAYGTNDFISLKSIQELEKNATEYIFKLKKLYAAAKFFGITPVWRMDEDKPREIGTFKQCCTCIKTVMQRLNVEIIDGDKILPHITQCMADTVHPNDLGFSLYMLNVIKQLKKKL